MAHGVEPLHARVLGQDSLRRVHARSTRTASVSSTQTHVIELFTLAAIGVGLKAVSDISAHGGFWPGSAAFAILEVLIMLLPEAPGTPGKPS